MLPLQVASPLASGLVRPVAHEAARALEAARGARRLDVRRRARAGPRGTRRIGTAVVLVAAMEEGPTVDALLRLIGAALEPADGGAGGAELSSELAVLLRARKRG